MKMSRKIAGDVRRPSASAREQLRQLEARIGDRNRDLSDAQIQEMAVRAGREINRAANERWVAESAPSHADR